MDSQPFWAWVEVDVERPSQNPPAGRSELPAGRSRAACRAGGALGRPHAERRPLPSAISMFSLTQRSSSR
jgi:hypothetical protein